MVWNLLCMVRFVLKRGPSCPGHGPFCPSRGPFCPSRGPFCPWSVLSMVRYVPNSYHSRVKYIFELENPVMVYLWLRNTCKIAVLTLGLLLFLDHLNSEIHWSFEAWTPMILFSFLNIHSSRKSCYLILCWKLTLFHTCILHVLTRMLLYFLLPCNYYSCCQICNTYISTIFTFLLDCLQT